MAIEIPETLDTLEGLDPKYKALYAPRDDGRYEYKDPSAVVNAYRSTKETLQREKEEAARLRQEFEARKDIDPIKYRDLLARESELEEAQRAAGGEFERIKTELKTAHEAQLAQARKGEETWRTRYAMDKLEAQIESELRAKGVTEAGLKLLKPQIANAATIEYEGDKPTHKFLDGNRIKLNAEADPYTIADFAEEYRKEYPGLFQSAGMGGSGASSPGVDLKDITDIENILDWSLAKKNHYANTYGEDAYKKAIATATARKTEAQIAARTNQNRR